MCLFAGCIFQSNLVVVRYSSMIWSSQWYMHLYDVFIWCYIHRLKVCWFQFVDIQPNIVIRITSASHHIMDSSSHNLWSTTVRDILVRSIIRSFSDVMIICYVQRKHHTDRQMINVNHIGHRYYFADWLISSYNIIEQTLMSLFDLSIVHYIVTTSFHRHINDLYHQSNNFEHSILMAQIILCPSNLNTNEE